MRPAATIFTAGFLLLFPAPALPLTGGEYVDASDIGAKASVAIYHKGRHLCGGAVYKANYIITAAHCFTDGTNGTVDIDSDDLEVFYWANNFSREDSRKVSDFVIHEHYPEQEEKAERLGDQLGDIRDFPVHHEDIAVVKIDGTHPDSAVSVHISPIVNEYTGDGETPKGDATWFYVYGASVNGTPGRRLQRAMVGSYWPLTRVIPGKEPDIFYIVRQLQIITGGNFAKVSECKGDSGTGMFLVKSDGMEYDPDAKDLPKGGIKLKDGKPMLVGVVQGNPVQTVGQKNSACGLFVKAEAFRATRTDYYEQWIEQKIRELE